MKNQFFQAIRYIDNDMHEVLTCMHIKRDRDICKEILENYAYMPCIDKTNLKELFLNEYIDIYTMFENTLLSMGYDINDPHIEIWLATSNDYRQFDKQYDNERSFIEYVNSEISEYDRRKKITPEILLDAGFKDVTSRELIDAFDNSNPNSHIYTIWTDKFDKDEAIKLDIDNIYTNRGTNWHVHIDNCDCDSIGSADIDTVWQFNMLMEVFGSNLRL